MSRPQVYKRIHKQTKGNTVLLRARGVVVTTGVVLAYAGGAALLAWATRGLLSAPAASHDLDLLLGLCAGAAAWAVLTWLTVALALTVLALSGPGGTALRSAALRLAPHVVQRLAALLLGAGLAGAPLWSALPAHATQGPPAGGPPAVAGTVAPSPPLDRPVDDLAGWTPDRPAAPAPVRRTPPVGLVTTVPHAGSAVRDEVVVRRGDTLWDLAARLLGPQAGAAEVAREWPRWHAANRDLIGPDPDLIRPGQRLRPPAA